MGAAACLGDVGAGCSAIKPVSGAPAVSSRAWARSHAATASARCRRVLDEPVLVAQAESAGHQHGRRQDRLLRRGLCARAEPASGALAAARGTTGERG